MHGDLFPRGVRGRICHGSSAPDPPSEGSGEVGQVGVQACRLLLGQVCDMRRSKQRVLHPEALLHLLGKRPGPVPLGKRPDLTQRCGVLLMWVGHEVADPLLMWVGHEFSGGHDWVGHEIADPGLCPSSTDLIRVMVRIRGSGLGLGLGGFELGLGPVEKPRKGTLG